jgi:hypothetical protein
MARTSRTFGNWCKNGRELMLLMIGMNILIYALALINSI